MVTEQVAADPTQAVPSAPTAEQLSDLTPDPTTLTPSPTPEAIDSGEVAEPEPETPEPPIWAAIHDRDALLDLPEIDEVVNDRVSRRVGEQRQVDFEELRTFQEQLKGDAVMQKVEGSVGGLLEKIMGGDYDGAEGIVATIKNEIMSVFAPAYEETRRAAAKKEAVKEDILFAIDEAKKLLPEAGKDKLTRLVNNGEMSWPVLYSLAKEQWVGPVQKQLDAKTQELETYKLEVRKGQGLNLGDTPGAGKGGMTYAQLVALPPEEYEKVPRETKQALFAEDARKKAL